MRRYFTQNNLLTFLALIAFVCCVFFGVSKSYQPMWVLFLLCLALLVFANLDRLKWFKVDKSGFEAETREIVKEARNTIKELQDLSKIMANISLGLLKRAGRFGGGYSYGEKENLKDSVLNVLRQIGVSNEECERIVTESKWHRYTEFDYVHHILGGSKFPDILSKQQLSERRKFANRGLDNIPTPEELTQFFAQIGLFNNEVKGLIEDYEHYVKFRQHRRPAVWGNRENWSHLLKKDK
jgi:hypothetical protein